jgi:hypothetical protein
MCTVSWVHEADGYELLCNRDEKRTRAQAHAPRIHTARGVRFIAPIDGDFGGTWIWTNQFGLSICLLNGANLSGTDGAQRVVHRMKRSRGLLMMDLVGAPSAARACALVHGIELRPFAPFTLVILEPDLPAAIVEWNGAEKSIVLHGDPYMPLVSSSFDPAGVRFRRQELFRRYTNGEAAEADDLLAFHSSHGSGAGAYSPCMHRTGAETVSMSRVKVSESVAEFSYFAGSPCRWRSGQWRNGECLILPLVH